MAKRALPMGKTSGPRFLMGFYTALVILFISGCATIDGFMPKSTHGVYHTVEKGEDLLRIGEAYKTDPTTIARYNNIFNPEDVLPGDVIFIPGARRVVAIPPPTPDELAAEIKKGLLKWPVEGMIFSLFGRRWGRNHDGLDISAPTGSSVSAAKSGDVIFVGRKGGYGVVVEIRHDEHYLTIYAHLSETLVEEGDRVRIGQTIGKVGCTGRCTGPHCHFEVRYDDTPQNPLFFLP